MSDTIQPRNTDDLRAAMEAEVRELERDLLALEGEESAARQVLGELSLVIQQKRGRMNALQTALESM